MVANGTGLYLHWEGNRMYRQRVPTPRMLDPMPALSFNHDSANLIIEGDNLQILTSLYKGQYKRQVDVIYIDPPYNLGKDDFRYSDARFHDPDADDSDAVYVTNEDGGRHTKWLNFMAPRLYMLWEILRDDGGVLFVSINDVELFRLGMLLNEICGEDNWVGTVVWHGATDNNPTNIATEHEYVLCYAKHKSDLPSQWTSVENEVKAFMLEAFKQMKAEGLSLPELRHRFAAFAKEQKEYLGDLYRYRRVDNDGPYAQRRNLDNPGKPGFMYDVIHPITHKPCRKPGWGWRFTEETMNDLIKRGRIVFGKDETQIPQLKVYLEEVDFPFRSVIENIDARAGSNDLERLFGKRDVFKNPKPVALIELLLSYTAKKDALVLDAFAGSGTTAESVLKLNKRDGGHRRFILIEEGKSKIGRERFCRTLTAERVKRAIDLDKYDDGFTFLTSGRKIDRKAIIGLERDALANLICQADETGLGRGISRLNGGKYIIGKNARSEAICLLWNGVNDSEVTSSHLKDAAAEVTQAGLKRPFRIYGTFCRVADTASWKFCKIPDEILAQMHIQEDSSEPEGE